MPDYPNLVSIYLAAPIGSQAAQSSAANLLRTATSELGAVENHVIPELRNALRTQFAAAQPEDLEDVEDGRIGELVSAWNFLSVVAALNGATNEATSLATALLGVLRAEQAQIGHVHKGTPLHQIGWVHLTANSEALAEPYFVAALTEDFRRDPDTYREGAAARVLEHRFKREDPFFSSIEAAIGELLDENHPLHPISTFDPDLLALAFGMSSSVGSNPLRFSLPFDHSLGAFLRQWQQAAITTEEKGDRFEVLVSYLLRTLAGYEARGQVQTLDGENDLLLRDLADRPSALGEYVLVECKNWGTPVGAPALKKFAQDVRSASCHSGIFVARSGITGADHRDARYTVRKSYHRDGVVVIVLDDDDIEKVLMREVDFPDFLRSRYEQIRFDEPH